MKLLKYFFFLMILISSIYFLIDLNQLNTENGETIKKIRECSQNEISNIMKSKIHLYLQVNKLND